MGGNSRIIDRQTGDIKGYAEKVDLTMFNRTELTRRMLGLFSYINVEFFKNYGVFIWKFEDLTEALVFTGSSKHLFNSEITDQDFIKHKPIIGDIDIAFPKDYYTDLAELLQSLEGETLVEGITYLGQDRNNFNTTFLSVFEYKSGKDKVNIQIDFESNEWDMEKNEPTEWTLFSHSSSWEDICRGFKGVHHKFLLINLVRALSSNPNAVVATKSSTPDNIKLCTGKKADLVPRMLAFSVDKGLRQKYAPMIDKNGYNVYKDGKLVIQEIPVENSTYTTAVSEIVYGLVDSVFDIYKPGNDTCILEVSKEEIEDFYSVIGLLDFMKKRLLREDIAKCFMFIVHENLFGTHAQLLEKEDLELDRKIKDKLWIALMNKFFYLHDEYYDIVLTLRKKYYQDNAKI